MRPDCHGTSNVEPIRASRGRRGRGGARTEYPPRTEAPVRTDRTQGEARSPCADEGRLGGLRHRRTHRGHVRIPAQGRGRGVCRPAQGEREGKPLRPLDQGADGVVPERARSICWRKKRGAQRAIAQSNGAGSQWAKVTTAHDGKSGIRNALRPSIPRTIERTTRSVDAPWGTGPLASPGPSARRKNSLSV